VPRKKGLEYFTIDTDIEISDKIALIEAKHGAVRFTVIIKLLIKIYGDNGYYYDWNERTKLIFSRRINLNYEKVDEIVKDAVKYEFFDKNKFKKYQILTSARIQDHYIHSTKRRKRVEVKRAFLVLNNQNDEIYRENVYILEENTDISTHKIREDKKYIHILNFWNSEEIIKHRPLKPMLKQIKRDYKKYGKDKIIKAVENY